LQLVTKGTAERWAGQICTQLSKSVEAIIATGRLLVEAKADLDHGEWGRMFEAKLIPLSQDAAEMFMKIAQHPRLSNSEQVRNLPSSYTTLYELTKLPDKALDKAFKEGRITPAMERKEVQALMPVARSARPAPSLRASTRARATYGDCERGNRSMTERYSRSAAARSPPSAYASPRIKAAKYHQPSRSDASTRSSNGTARGD
jgi:Protein of unknown function (DUF3102)